MQRRTLLKTTALVAVASMSIVGAAWAENPHLKIGFVGVTSGPAAAWGISNQRSMEARAAWLNETGGVKIGPDVAEELRHQRPFGVGGGQAVAHHAGVHRLGHALER